MYNQIKLTGYAVILEQQGYSDFRLCPTKSGAEAFAKYLAEHYLNVKIYMCRAEKVYISPRYEYHGDENESESEQNKNG